MRSLLEQFELDMNEEVTASKASVPTPPEKVEIKDDPRPYSGVASDDEIMEFNKTVEKFFELVRKYTPIHFSTKRIINPPENVVIIQYVPKVATFSSYENILLILGELCGFEELDEKVFGLEAHDLAFRQVKNTDIDQLTAQDVWGALTPYLTK